LPIDRFREFQRDTPQVARIVGAGVFSISFSDSCLYAHFVSWIIGLLSVPMI
jgi:hypothetical protein